jgi:hypothetical protein
LSAWLPYIDARLNFSSSHYETDFGVSSAFGARNTKIGFLKARHRRAFKKPIKNPKSFRRTKPAETILDFIKFSFLRRKAICKQAKMTNII